MCCACTEYYVWNIYECTSIAYTVQQRIYCFTCIYISNTESSGCSEREILASKQQY